MRPGRIRPGKMEAYAEVGVDHDLASMRPGRIRPGKVGAADCKLRPNKSFNEAGADPPRKDA